MVLLVCQCGCVGACDIIGDQKTLPGGYYLESWEDGDHYTLGGPTHSADAGGVLVGSVEKVGWNDHYIVAWRSPMLADDAGGWMIVDVRTHTVRGPLTDSQFEAEVAKDQLLRTIKPVPPEDHWGAPRRRTTR
jgi:hypothetical protein